MKHNLSIIFLVVSTFFVLRNPCPHKVIKFHSFRFYIQLYDLFLVYFCIFVCGKKWGSRLIFSMPMSDCYSTHFWKVCPPVSCTSFPTFPSAASHCYDTHQWRFHLRYYIFLFEKFTGNIFSFHFSYCIQILKILINHFLAVLKSLSANSIIFHFSVLLLLTKFSLEYGEMLFIPIICMSSNFLSDASW